MHGLAATVRGGCRIIGHILGGGGGGGGGGVSWGGGKLSCLGGGEAPPSLDETLQGPTILYFQVLCRLTHTTFP